MTRMTDLAGYPRLIRVNSIYYRLNLKNYYLEIFFKLNLFLPVIRVIFELVKLNKLTPHD
jgi:hypothetical protein